MTSLDRGRPRRAPAGEKKEAIAPVPERRERAKGRALHEYLKAVRCAAGKGM